MTQCLRQNSVRSPIRSNTLSKSLTRGNTRVFFIAFLSDERRRGTGEKRHVRWWLLGKKVWGSGEGLKTVEREMINDQKIAEGKKSLAISVHYILAQVTGAFDIKICYLNIWIASLRWWLFLPCVLHDLPGHVPKHGRRGGLLERTLEAVAPGRSRKRSFF